MPNLNQRIQNPQFANISTRFAETKPKKKKRCMLPIQRIFHLFLNLFDNIPPTGGKSFRQPDMRNLLDWFASTNQITSHRRKSRTHLLIKFWTLWMEAQSTKEQVPRTFWRESCLHFPFCCHNPQCCNRRYEWIRFNAKQVAGHKNPFWSYYPEGTSCFFSM